MNFINNMNIFKFIYFVVLSFLINQTIYAQDTKARVTVTATANDNIEAKNIALRSAIEQAFGAYISSNTEILNDELIKDEITSISSGNIDSIHIISENKLGDGRTSVTLLAVVSVNKLANFCESQGYKVDFKGGSPLALENSDILKHRGMLKSIPANKKQLVFEEDKKGDSLLDESNIKE